MFTVRSRLPLFCGRYALDQTGFERIFTAASDWPRFPRYVITRRKTVITLGVAGSPRAGVRGDSPRGGRPRLPRRDGPCIAGGEGRRDGSGVQEALALVVVVAAGTTLYFVLHHPPMRLMPPPLLFQVGGDRVFDVAPDLVDGSRSRSSTAPAGCRSDRRTTGSTRSRRTATAVGTATLRIGEEGTTLDQIREWTTRADGRPAVPASRGDAGGRDPSARAGARDGPRGAWFAADRRGAGAKPRPATSSSTSMAPTPRSSGRRGRRRRSATSRAATRWSSSSPGPRPRTSCAMAATSRTPSPARRIWPN